MDNIIFVTVDCLRARNMGCFGYQRDTTPKIDEISKTGLKFENCFANGPYTFISFPSLLSSVYPAMYDGGKIPENVPLISELLSNAGYTTAGITAANPNLTPQYGYTGGFDTYVDFITNEDVVERHIDGGSKATDGTDRGRDTESASAEPSKLFESLSRVVKVDDRLHRAANKIYSFSRYQLLNPIRKIRNYAQFLLGRTPSSLTSHTSPSSKQVVDKAVKWLEQKTSSEPFFLWIHLMDPHSWYDPDPQYVSEVADRNISRPERFRANRALMSSSPFRGGPNIARTKQHQETLHDLYDASIRQADDEIGRLWEYIERMPTDRETKLVLTADHGEEFLEHGNVQHGSFLYDELLHVPLIIAGDGVSPATVPGTTQLLDVPPTIAEIAGVNIPEEYYGQSLAGELTSDHPSKDRTVVSATEENDSISARDARYTYITHADDRKDEYYDRKNDPREQENLGSINSSVEDRFEEAIEEYLSLTDPPILTSECVQPSEEIRMMLEDLGYK